MEPLALGLEVTQTSVGAGRFDEYLTALRGALPADMSVVRFHIPRIIFISRQVTHRPNLPVGVPELRHPSAGFRLGATRNQVLTGMPP